MSPEMKNAIVEKFLAHKGYMDRKIARQLLKTEACFRFSGVKVDDVFDYILTLPRTAWK